MTWLPPSSGLVLTAYQSDLLQELTNADIRFVVIGGKALEVHGLCRDSWDLDLWTSCSGGSPDRLFQVLSRRIPRSAPPLSPELLRCPKKRVALPADPQLDKEVDILTSVGDLDFDLVFGRSIRAHSDQSILQVAAVDDLIAMKRLSLAGNESRAAKRRDRGDLRALIALQNRSGGPA